MVLLKDNHEPQAVVQGAVGKSAALILARPATYLVRIQARPRPLMLLVFSLTMQVGYSQYLSMFPEWHSHRTIKTPYNVKYYTHMKHDVYYIFIKFPPT